MASPRPPYAFPTPLSLTVAPSTESVLEDGTVQFTLTAHLDDGTDADYTHDAAVRWASSDEAIATVNTGVSTGGKTFGVFPGAATISATWISVLDIADVPGVPTDPWPPDSPPYGSTAVAALTVTATAPVADPEGRFLLAFDQPTLEPYPTWTRLDDAYPNLVTSYSIDRGRQYELDRFDTGRAQVDVADPDGILNPLNPDGPFYGVPGPYGPLLKPLMQAAIGRRNPVTGEWKLRYRGFVEAFDYTFDPSQKLNRLTISLVDLFDILSAAGMQPGQFGSAPPGGSEGQIFFAQQTVEQRIAAALAAFGLSRRFQILFPGNVILQSVVYSPAESPMAVVQEAADGELPGANVYCDRRGRIVFHDRFARFYPAETAASVTPDKWDYHEWKVGDGAAIEASPTDTVQLREFAFDRGVSRLINSASAVPANEPDEAAAGQLVTEPESIAYYGIRSWSADGLLTFQSLLDGNNALEETRLFAWYLVANFKWLRDRITAITFRPLRPEDPRAPALWDFLSTVDIGDTLGITIQSPGGGGYTNYQHFVEGVHEQVSPLVPDYDDVTLRLDLSPVADYATSPWPAPAGLLT